MSVREPMWFCHECHAEMRPLMIPDPICASCRSSFVEKLENPTDDPRDFQHRGHNTFDVPNDLPGAFEGSFRSSTVDPRPNPPPPNSLPLGSWRSNDSSAARSSSPPLRSPPTQRPQDNPSTTGFHFEFQSGPGRGNTRTFVFGGPNTLGRSQQQPERRAPTLLEFLRREADNANNMRTPGDITGPLMAQYLLALFSRDPQARGDPFADLLGMPPSARWGDYVFNQEALDQILTHLAENSTAGRPVPATEEVINNLPRDVLTSDSPLLEKDCAVCKESFKLDAEDPDELVVVTLPCKHSFHEGCIVPWLKSSGTCPVCRFPLTPQPQQHSPGGPSGGSSSSNHTNPPSGGSPRSPGNSDRGGSGGIFHALFGGGAGASGGSSDTYSTRSQQNLARNNRHVHPEIPFFPGQWIEDID